MTTLFFFATKWCGGIEKVEKVLYNNKPRRKLSFAQGNDNMVFVFLRNAIEGDIYGKN